ncbi:MAG: transporter substrate-binding domain-containing protein [Synergistaceae bacterium]|nr:transporter substrate-binding domain-containing protein [Synergistaceae bacterium]
MRKSVVAAILAVLVLAGCASAEVIGRYTIFNLSEEDAAYKMRPDETDFYMGIDVSRISVKYYNSISAMLLALTKGDVDSILVPRAVGRYILENQTNSTIRGINWWLRENSATLNFGFMEKNLELAKKFNSAITAMKADGTLAALEKNYVDNWSAEKLPVAASEKFDDADTVTVALTGDLPPIDYVDASGNPAGYNTAVLAEIGRRLHINIKTVNIESGARIAALTSGVADVIFWFRRTMYNDAAKTVADRAGNEVILSEPYYMWNEQYFIGRK